jgi:hypothetical protein
MARTFDMVRTVRYLSTVAPLDRRENSVSNTDLTSLSGNPVIEVSLRTSSTYEVRDVCDGS